MAVGIKSFVATQVRWHRFWHVLGGLLAHALALALVLWAVAAWLPGWLGPGLWASAAWMLWVFVSLVRRPGLRVVDLDHTLELQDSLATLWTCGSSRGLSPWLQRHVAACVEQMPPRRRRRVWWGAMRRAVVLLALVCLAVWLGPLWSLLPVGLTPSGGAGPKQELARQQGTEDGNQPGAGSGSKPESKPQDPNPPDAKTAAPKPTQAQPPDPDTAANPAPQPPPPVQPLMPARPLQREFVVPTWIHHGPSTRVKAPVVGVPRKPPENPPRQRPGQRPEPQQPEAQLREFQRAAERAQHARHVPPRERPFVRRYFGELVRVGRGR